MSTPADNIGFAGIEGELCNSLYGDILVGVREALARGANPNATRYDGDTLLSLTLQWLSRRPSTPVYVTMMLESGGDLRLSHLGVNLGAVVSSDSLELVQTVARFSPDWNFVMDYRPSCPCTILDELDSDIELEKKGQTSTKLLSRDIAKMEDIRELLVGYGAVKYNQMKNG